MNPRVAVCNPMYGYLPVHASIRRETFLLNSLAKGEMQANLYKEELYVSAARNELVRDAVDAGCTHALFLDQDNPPPPGAISRLLSHRKAIVGGLYFQKIAPHLPVAGNFDDTAMGWEPLKEVKWGQLQRVDLIGAGCMMLDLKKCVEALGEPPKKTLTERGEVYEAGTWFDVNSVGRGEDIEFCRRAKQAGLSVYVDAGLVIPHIGTVIVGKEYHGMGRTPTIQGS